MEVSVNKVKVKKMWRMKKQQGNTDLTNWKRTGVYTSSLSVWVYWGFAFCIGVFFVIKTRIQPAIIFCKCEKINLKVHQLLKYI